MNVPLKALIIEDSKDEALLLMQELRRGCYDVEFDRVDKPQAMQQALARFPWDIVIADYSLLQFSGLDALSIWRQSGSDAPFIFVSGAVGEEQAVAAMRAGAHDYLMKDNLTGLVPAVRRELTQAEMRRQRRRTQQGLKESEERFRRVFEEGPLGIALVNPDFRFASANSALCRLLGYTEEELTSMRFVELIHPQDRETDARLAERLFRGEIPSYRLEERLITKDSEEKWIALTASIIRDRNGHVEYGLGMIADITERKRAEEALKTSEQRLELAHDAAGMGMFDWDIVHDQAVCNERYFRLVGREPRDRMLSEEDWLEMLHPDDRERARRDFQNAIEGNDLYHSEYRVIWPDTSVKWVSAHARIYYDDDGGPYRMIGVLTDITEPKAAAEALRESQTRLQQIADTVEDVFWMTDWLTHKTIFASRAYERIWGRSLESLYADAQAWAKAIHPDDRKRAWETFVQLDEGESYDEEYRILRSDGSVRWIRDRGFPIRDEIHGIYRVAGIAQDITERKLAQEKLQLLSSAIGQASEGIAVCDMAGKLLYINASFAEMHGYAPEELVGKHLSVFHNLDQMSAVEAANRELLEAGAFHGELDHVRRDGSTFLTAMHNSVIRDQSGIPVALVGTIRDVTERRRVEGALRESESRFRALFKNMTSGVAVYQAGRGGKDFIFKDLNEAGQRLTNVSKEQVIGRNLTHVFPGIEEMGLVEVLKRVWSTGIPARHPTALYQDERLSRWFDNQVYKLPSGEVVAVFHDVTERKIAEQELAKYRDHLEELVKERTTQLEEAHDELLRKERLATIGQVAASIAHELRNPLGAVRNAAYYLRQLVPPRQPKWKEHLGIIDQEVSAADRIIANLLEMTRPKEPIRRPVDLGHLVDEVCLSAAAPAGVSWSCSVDPQPFLVTADAGQLRQVLGNLVMNAVQSMQGGGNILVDVTRHQEYDLITVQDSGTGIAPEHRDRLFEPLFSTKAKGTGLGLAICRQVIEQHGGIVYLAESTGCGSKFCIQLPRDQ